MGQTIEHIEPTYAYDALTYSFAIVGVSSLTVVFSEVGDPQPFTTTTIGSFTRTLSDIWMAGDCKAFIFRLSAMDPFGTLTAVPLQGAFGTCGQNANSRVQYRLDAPNPPFGYLVQKVIACRVSNGCPQPCNKSPCHPEKDECKLKALGKEDCVEYYEIPTGQGNLSSVDNFSIAIPDETCGQHIQLGEARFYPASITGNANPNIGPITLPFPTGGTISSGSAQASTKMPGFWNQPPTVGPIFHSFGVSWNCCCDNNSVNSKRDFSDKKPTPKQVLQEM